ncbi:MAG: ATP-binding protein [Desulfuromonadaceae bacterium]|nr:ATP-binding protein [Desulfuromonadaceae bacterium]
MEPFLKKVVEPITHMPRRRISILVLILAVSLTAGLSWFAVRNYSAAAPIANDSLRGLALTIASAMEGVAGRDPSLKSLASFQTSEVAYAMLISSTGTIRFHSNSDLIGNDVKDSRYRDVLTSGTLGEERIRLGTGEQVYEFQAPFHLPAETCVLRLALHTWRYEAVMRRARFGITLIFSLLVLGWGLGGAVFWLLRRQELQEKQLMREHELARLGEVGAVLAHEVRNPLAGIKGYGQLLEERLPDGSERGFARLIVAESTRMEALVNDILLYTRSEPMPLSECLVAEIAASVLELLAPAAEAAGVHFVCTLPPDLIALCPEEGVRRVLLNLVSNALQASPRDGAVTVSGAREQGWVTVRVEDDGPGISADMRPLLFEPFRTSKARGAGLGLAVCKKIVTACDGEIWAADAAGGGALFTVRLPRAGKDGSIC